MRSIRILFLFCGALHAGLILYQQGGFRPTDVTVRGRALRERDLNEGLTELSDLTPVLGTYDPEKISAFEAKTELGRYWKRVGLQAAIQEARLMEEVESLHVEALLDPAHLRSRELIEDGIRRMDRYARLQKDRFDGRVKACQLLAGVLGNQGEVRDFLGASTGVLEEHLDLELRFAGTTKRYLEFALEKRPSVDPKDGTTYWDTDADISTSNFMRQSISESLEALVDFEEGRKATSDEN